MGIIVSILIIVVVTTGAILARNTIEIKESDTDTGAEIQTQIETEIENVEKSVLGVEIQDEETPEPSPVPQPIQNQSGLEYPGSRLISSSGDASSYESSDSPDKITDWYKQKIKEMNMNVTSFVTTKANEKVLNKLVGADGSREIRVEIKQETKEGNTEILISSKS